MVKTKSKQNLRVESQRIYSYWHTLFLSFFSSRLYWDVYKRWRGLGILYLLLMVSILCIPLSLKTINNMRFYFKNQIIAPIHRLPDIPYVSGKLKFDKKMPYYIKNDKGEVETVIDNTGAHKKFDRKKYPELRFLFIDNMIFYTFPDASDFIFSEVGEGKKSRVREVKVPNDISFVFNGDTFLDEFHIDNLKKLTLTSIYPLTAFTFYFVSLVFLLPLAMMGQIISQTIFKVRLYFKQSCRLLCVASTPAFFALQIMALFQYDQHITGFVWLIVMAIYFSYSVIILKRNLRSISRL